MRTLNRKKRRWLIKEWDRGELSMTYICKTMGITPRYGWKLYRKYEKTGTLPYPKKPGRRSKPISEEDKQRILAMKERHPLSGADTLEKLLDQVGPHIPHNRIHVVLKAAGRAKDEPKKQKQRRYVRYERKHSNSLWHTDLFEKYQGDNLAILYEDDASRLITGGYLIDRPTAANCVIAGESAVSLFGRPIQLMSDHGTTFTSLPREGCEEPNPNEFQQWLALSEIVHVKSTVKHPQSNGKVEKAGGIMRKLVEHFGTLEHALYYYNFERPHWSLNIEVCETPFRAFLRKMRPEQRGAFVRANGALVAQHAPEYLNLGEEIVK